MQRKLREGKAPNCCIAGRLQKRKSTHPGGASDLHGEKREEERKQTPVEFFFSFFKYLFQLFLHLTGALRDPPAPRLGVAGVEPAPVTSLGSRSPTRPTPVKPQPRPLRDALPVAREPGTVSARRRHPRRDGGPRGPRRPGAPLLPPARPRRDAPARRPRRDAPGVPAPFPSLLSGPRRPRSSPGQGQLFGAAVLRGVVLPRRRRRRWRGLGGRGSARGFGRHDAQRGPARAAEGGARGGGRARAHAGHAPSSPDSRYKNNGNVPRGKPDAPGNRAPGPTAGKRHFRPRRHVREARGPRASVGNRGGGGGGGGQGRGRGRGRGREAAGKPRLPGPVSARVVPVGGASRGGAGPLRGAAASGRTLDRARPSPGPRGRQNKNKRAGPVGGGLGPGGRSRVGPLVAFWRQGKMGDARTDYSLLMGKQEARSERDRS